MELRLKELREERKLTQEKCAEIGFISKNSYIRYESKERLIPLETAVLYARYYKVTLDYIAGLTERKGKK